MWVYRMLTRGAHGEDCCQQLPSIISSETHTCTHIGGMVEKSWLRNPVTWTTYAEAVVVVV